MECFALKTFKRKSPAGTVDHIDDQLGMFLVLILRNTDVEVASTNLAEIFVTLDSVKRWRAINC